MRHPL